MKKRNDNHQSSGFMLFCIGLILFISLTTSLLGKFGNVVSELLTVSLGYLSFSVPFIFGIIGWNLLFKNKWLKQVLIVSVFTVELSMLLGLENSSGLFGRLLVNKICYPIFEDNHIGPCFILLLFLLGTLIRVFHIDIRPVFLKIKDIVLGIGHLFLRKKLIPIVSTGNSSILDSMTISEVEIDRKIPDLTLLEEPKLQVFEKEKEVEKSKALKIVLEDFGIYGEIAEINCGPVVTRYELSPVPGTKFSKVEKLSRDIAVALGVEKILVSSIPGKTTIGIEVPNVLRQTVYLREILSSQEFKKDMELKFGLGKDTAGNPVVVDLVKMPHLLIAGTTGSGKSVCVNTLIASLLLSKTPQELRFVLIDPKVVELSIYKNIPHLIGDVLTTAEEAIKVLRSMEDEMNKRYQLLASVNCRNITEYNKTQVKLPYIVIIIDELADLMLTGGKELEKRIVSIAQKARAIGIHLVLATQRPEAKVVTGLIKANIPSKIALTVNSALDSRIILDCNGAEELLGKGDMLLKTADMNQPKRVHGAFITTIESEELIKCWNPKLNLN